MNVSNYNTNLDIGIQNVYKINDIYNNLSPIFMLSHSWYSVTEN